MFSAYDRRNSSYQIKSDFESQPSITQKRKDEDEKKIKKMILFNLLTLSSQKRFKKKFLERKIMALFLNLLDFRRNIYYISRKHYDNEKT